MRRVLALVLLMIAGCSGADPNDARSRPGSPKVGDKRVMEYMLDVYSNIDGLRHHVAHRDDPGYNQYPRDDYSIETRMRQPTGMVRPGEVAEVLEIGPDFVRVQHLDPITNTGVAGYAKPFW